jgi:hypothetical protein
VARRMIYMARIIEIRLDLFLGLSKTLKTAEKQANKVSGRAKRYSN